DRQELPEQRVPETRGEPARPRGGRLRRSAKKIRDTKRVLAGSAILVQEPGFSQGRDLGKSGFRINENQAEISKVDEFGGDLGHQGRVDEGLEPLELGVVDGRDKRVEGVLRPWE